MKLQDKLLHIGVFMILFALPLGLTLWAARSPTNNPPAPQESDVAAQFERPDAANTPSTGSDKLIIGNPEAPVTLIEYGDFQCTFCAQFFRQTEPSLLQDYINTGKVKIEFRVETHIGRESVRAGEAAYCANDQGFFKEYHDELYMRQSGENRGAFSDDNLQQIAADVGLDTTMFVNCLETNKYLAAVEASNDEARQRGVSTTPTIYIGEHKVSGAQPYAIYKSLLDAELQ